LDIATGDKLARVDPRSLSNRLRSFDWIESSQVSRNWISGKVSISITTRTPIALYSEPGKPQVVLDASGNTFATPADIAEGLPKVSAKSVDGGLAAIKVFTSLPESFSKNIDRMSAARSDNFLIYGKFEGQDLRIIWGDGKDTDLKVEVILALLQREENKDLRMIDVSAPHAPIVK
jgi:cell division septal protein FtsQ